ncbi:prolyl oligopeptidase family serine peptidase [bacterium]|nr:prolyl oligopeptidase family serine peptidase [bacterium]
MGYLKIIFLFSLLALMLAIAGCGNELKYLTYLPKDFPDGQEKYPLMLFLHGAGERGDDLDLVKRHGPPQLIEKGQDMPFIVIAPQCPEELWWPMKTTELLQLIETIEEKYPVDESRIYCTGLSMGGFGTWALAIEQPDLFAAIAPICGGGDSTQVRAIKDVPTWVFHGAKDTVVPIEKSQILVDSLHACGGDVKFTIYPEATHNSWTETYDNPEFYEWLLSHTKK